MSGGPPLLPSSLQGLPGLGDGPGTGVTLLELYQYW